MTDTYFSLAPLDNGTVDSTQVHGGEGDPPQGPLPPQLNNPLGNRVNVEDEAIVDIDVSGDWSDPNGETLTFSAIGLPAGLSMSPAGVISGTPTTPQTTSYTITATNESALQTQDQGLWQITAAGTPAGYCPNWPNVQAHIATGSSERIFSEGIAAIYMRGMEFGIRQPTNTYNSAGQQKLHKYIGDWYNENWRGVQAHGVHMNINTNQAKREFISANGMFGWRYEAMYDEGKFDDYVSKAGNGDYQTRQTASINSGQFRWAGAWQNDVYVYDCAQAEFDGYRNVPRGTVDQQAEGQYSTLPFKPVFAHDGMPVILRKRYSNPIIKGENDGLTGPNLKQFRIPTWANATDYYVGSPDGNGFTAVKYNQQNNVKGTLSLHIDRMSGGNPVEGWSVEVLGHKTDNGTDLLLVKQDLPSTGHPSGNGWNLDGSERWALHVAKGSTYATDWDDDGANENRFDDTGGGPLRRQQTLKFYQRYRDRCLALTGGRAFDPGFVFRNVGGDLLTFKDNHTRIDFPSPEDADLWEFPQVENWFHGSMMGGDANHQNDDPAVNEIWLVNGAKQSKIEELLLKYLYTLPIVSTTKPPLIGVKGVGVIAESRHIAYGQFTSYDASLIRFIKAICNQHEWMIPMISTTFPQSYEPWTTEEHCLYFGGAGANSDPAINTLGVSDATFYGRGSPVTDRPWDFTWRTPQFGSHGYVRAYENVYVMCNYRAMTNFETSAVSGFPIWRAHHLGYQSKINPANDVWTVSGLGPTKELRAFDPGGYTNPVTGETPHARQWAGTNLGYDPVLNNGGDPRVRGTSWDTPGANYWWDGDEIACGSLEGRYLIVGDRP